MYRTDLQTSRFDPRLSYCLYIPLAAQKPTANLQLVVVVHGSERHATAYRDAMVDFSEAHDCVILAPLFPAGIFGDDFGDGYKYLEERGLRYDEALISMVEEVEERLGCRFGRFGLFGFSGGGHFVHRFFYLHAQRLWGLVVGAPGGVTLIDPATDWWLGTRNAGRLFGREPAIAAMRTVPVQLIIGGEDTKVLNPATTSVNYRADTTRIGNTRMARMEALKANLQALGLNIEHIVVPSVAHDGIKLLDRSKQFLGRHMARHQGSDRGA